MCQLRDRVNAAGGVGVRQVMTIQRTARALAGLAVVGLVGCGGDTGREEAEVPEATTTEVTLSPTTTTTTTTTTTAPPTTTAAPATTAPVDTTTPATGCGATGDWGSGATETAPTTIAADLYLVRVGQHRCFDRIVFDVNGVVAGTDVVGLNAAYVGGGAPSLRVVVRAPALGYGGEGHQPGRLLARDGDDLVPTSDLASWKVLRHVRFAGSFEGQTTIAVGVTERRPFRVGAYESDGYSHVYVDVSH